MCNTDQEVAGSEMIDMAYFLVNESFYRRIQIF